MYKTYVLKDPITNLVRYVGCTKQKLNIRLNLHLKQKENTEKYKWQNQLKSIGLRPIIKELKQYDNLKDAANDEAEFIKIFKDIGHPLLNIYSGYTPLGHYPSEETRKKSSESHKEYFKNHPEAIQHRTEIRRKNGGFILSEQKIKKLNNAAINSTQKAVIKLDYNGSEIEKYISISEAARKNNLQPTLISMCCLGKRKTHGKFKWVFCK